MLSREVLRVSDCLNVNLQQADERGLAQPYHVRAEPSDGQKSIEDIKLDLRIIC